MAVISGEGRFSDNLSSDVLVGKLETCVGGSVSRHIPVLWTLPACILSLTPGLIFSRLCLWLLKGSTGKTKMSHSSWNTWEIQVNGDCKLRECSKVQIPVNRPCLPPRSTWRMCYLMGHKSVRRPQLCYSMTLFRKSASTTKETTFAEKSDSWLFCVYLWIEMQNGRVRVILFTVARILLAVAGRGVSSF